MKRLKGQTYLQGSTAKLDGFYDAKGRKLKGHKLTQAQVDEWNGLAPELEPVVVEAPVVEEVVVEEVVAEEVEASPSFISELSKKFGKKKK